MNYFQRDFYYNILVYISIIFILNKIYMEKILFLDDLNLYTSNTEIIAYLLNFIIVYFYTYNLIYLIYLIYFLIFNNFSIIKNRFLNNKFIVMFLMNLFVKFFRNTFLIKFFRNTFF